MISAGASPELRRLATGRQGAVALRTERSFLEKIPDFRVPHVVMIDRTDLPGDYHSKGVPALRGGIVRIEVVSSILALTLAILHHVLVTVAHDNCEVPVLLNPSLRDCLDCPPTTVAVFGQNRFRGRGCHLAGLGEGRLPARTLLCH